MYWIFLILVSEDTMGGSRAELPSNGIFTLTKGHNLCRRARYNFNQCDRFRRLDKFYVQV